MEWLNADAYDLGYQGMLKPFGLPDGDRVVVPVQRDSSPVIYDWDSRSVVGHIKLSDRRGNPHLTYRTDEEIWADDYDTLLTIDRASLTKVRETRLQGAGAGTQQFIGGWSFNPDRSLCAVGRPFAGDVVALEADSFEVRYRADLGRQPLGVALLSDGRVYARDWKSGDPLTGKLRPI